VPELVTLHLWRVPSRHVATAVARVAMDRRRVRGTAGARFAKLLGTGSGRTFRWLDADPRRWALLVAWGELAAARDFERSSVVGGWSRLAEETWRAELRPLAARGRWSRRCPFGDPAGRCPFGDPAGRWGDAGAAAGLPDPPDPPGAGDLPGSVGGAVAAVTRARLAWQRAREFWRAVPPVSADLAGRPGLRLAIGIGEAPVGLQGTFSLWESAAALRAFTRGSAAHREAVRLTSQRGWYAEELFARFAVLDAAGTVDARDPLR
jgi:hypothetical protein